MIFKLLICLLFVGLSTADSGAQGQGDYRVLLRDFTSITLYSGQYTTGRRSSPVAQLECVGGSAKGKFSPKSVQCYNRGWDGRDVQWECKAEMSEDYQFWKIEVSCEGYDYPNDPHVLSGSCGLRYELDYSPAGTDKYFWFYFEAVVVVLIILLVILVIYWMWSRSSNDEDSDSDSDDGDDGSPGFRCAMQASASANCTRPVV